MGSKIPAATAGQMRYSCHIKIKAIFHSLLCKLLDGIAKRVYALSIVEAKICERRFCLL